MNKEINSEVMIEVIDLHKYFKELHVSWGLREGERVRSCVV